MKSPSEKAKKSPVRIRFKDLADGCRSIYLDIYFKGKRKYEFLKLYVHPGDDEDTVLANAEAMRIAEEVRRERLAELGESEVAPAPTTPLVDTPADEKTAKARVKAHRASREPVTVRAKDLKDGRQSLYLDIYYRGERKYEFLKLYTNPGDEEGNAAIMQRANAIREARMAEIVKSTVEESVAEEATPEKKVKHKFKVLLAWRLLRNGDKSFYLYIHYGENGEQRCCEPLYLYAPADASEAEVKRIKAKAKAVKREREEELRNGTYIPRPSAREPKNVFDDTDHYKDFRAKRRAEAEVQAVTTELKRNSKSKEPVRIRFKKLANGSVSVYLAINVNGRRTYDYLKLYLVPETDQTAKLQNRQTMEAVYAIKAQRILQITNGAAGIKKDLRNKMRLVDWLKIYQDRQVNKGKRGAKRWVRTMIFVIEGYDGGKDATLADIDIQWLTDFMIYLMNDYVTYKKTKLTNGTVDNYLRCLKAAFNVAVEEGIMPTNPMLALDRSHLKGTTYEREFLSVEEVKKLIDTPCRRPDIKGAFLFSCFCGLRISDVRSLQWKHVVTAGEKMYLKITQFKTRRPLSIPLSRQALRWMPERGGAGEDEYIFPPLSKNMTVLDDWAKEAGINKHITFHVSRHTFATMELTMGADIYTTSKLLGHTSVATTQIYAKVINSKKEEAVSLLDSAFEL
jgi:integrase